MAFQFTCPYCFKKTLVDESVAGHSGACANCGKTVTVPEPPLKHAVKSKPVDSRFVEVKQVARHRHLLARMLQSLGLVAGLGVLSLLVMYLLWPTFQGLTARRNRIASLNNLQLIAKALDEYAVQYGTYPTPTVFDASGKPLYSWRVLILPQLGETALYTQFKLDEAWDSPNNVSLVSSCPRVFISPSAQYATGSAEANYVLLTGNNTVFPSSGPLSPQQIPDGKSNTLLVVETDNNKIEWSQPWDIDVSKLNTKIGASGPNTIGGIQTDGAAVVFCDGSSGWLPEDLPPVLLNGLISPQGGEPINPTDYQLK